MKRAAPLLLGFSLAVACSTKSFDLGSNEPVIVPPQKADASAPQTRVYGCVDWNDDEVLAKRGNACASVCPGEPFEGERFEIRTQKDVVAVTANRWMFCGSSPFRDARDAVGIEFTPGCRVYLLRRDDEGNLVRGTEARHQASFDIHVPVPPDGSPAVPEVDLHIRADYTLRYTLESAKCPTNWLRLVAEAPADEMILRPVDAEDLVAPQF